MQKIEINCLIDRIKDKRPKRILSLDGGGTKGIITIAMLAKIEAKLKELIPDDEKENFRLNQYFDYIGGTSTGSIIAVLLSLGYSVDKINKMYMDFSEEVFGFWAMKFITKVTCGKLPRYKAKPIEKLLFEKLGDKKLKEPSIYNLLAVFTKNTHTNNIWTFNNNPDSLYYSEPPPGKDWFANKEQYLRDIVRASTAAPIYFPPKKLQIRTNDSKNDKTALFIDGGVSMDNNPAFRLFLMATNPFYNLKWKRGKDNILVVSLGTGIFTQRYSTSLIGMLTNIPGMYINNSSQSTMMIMRSLSSHDSKRVKIDKELKDLNPQDFINEPSLSYIRYNYNFRHLKDKNGNEIKERKMWSEMDMPGTMKTLYKITSEQFSFNNKNQYFPDIPDIPDSFKSHYFDWDHRIIDGV